MADDDFELLSHKDITTLKKELNRLKEKPQGGKDSLQDSIENLADTISDMMDMFRDAAQSYKAEEAEEIVLSKKIEPISRKLDLLLEENRKIASGIVALADLIREGMADKERPEKKIHMAPPQPKPAMALPPRPGYGMPPPPGVMPPPPPRIGMPPPMPPPPQRE